MRNWTHCSLNTLALFLGTTFLLVATLGCFTSSNQPRDSGSPTSGTSGSGGQAKSNIPLRVWWVATNEDSQLLSRQWSANSDHPLDVRPWTLDELLAQERAACDLLIVPAKLVGELVERKWIDELPPMLQSKLSVASSSSQDSEAEVRAVPPAFTEQIQYAKKNWGVSLGCSVPVVLSNFTLPPSGTTPGSSQANLAWWEQAITLLREEAAKTANTSSSVQATKQAVSSSTLVARFLVIAGSLADRDSRFGLLMDPESMKPRLSEAHFTQAARLLRSMAESNPDATAITGSWADAWTVASGSQACLTIGLAQPDPRDASPTLRIEATRAPEIAASTTKRASWNVGEGSVVLLGRECRQSAQSGDFMRWISQNETRRTLAQSASGIHVGEGRYSAGSSAWRAAQLEQRLMSEPHLPIEPRCASADEYTKALAKELVDILAGSKTPEAGLAAASEAWNQITRDRGTDKQRKSYEQSLGL